MTAAGVHTARKRVLLTLTGPFILILLDTISYRTVRTRPVRVVLPYSFETQAKSTNVTGISVASKPEFFWILVTTTVTELLESLSLPTLPDLFKYNIVRTFRGDYRL